MYKPVKMTLISSNEETREKSVIQWKNMKHQYYAAFSANLIALTHGTITGWFAPAVPLLMSKDTPLASGPLTVEQISWIGSINFLGVISSIFTFGLITSFMGCKRVITILAMPAILFWLTIIFATSFYHILFARFALGWIGGGIQSIIVLYIAEIANDNIRGRLGSIAPLVRNVGVLVAYVVGATISYAYIPYIFMCLPIIFLIIFAFLPNTPQYLLQKGKFEKAERSLKYYKGGRKDDTEHDKKALKNEFERLQSIAAKRKSDKKIQLKDLFESKAIRGISIGIVLAFLAVFNGCMCIIVYAVSICKMSGMKMNPYMASVILATFQITATICTIRLADALKRKVILNVSLLGTSIGLFTLALYLYLVRLNYNLTHLSWIPITSLSFIVFMSSGGIVPLSNVCAVEHLPSKVRAIGMNIFTFWIGTFGFLSTKFFPILIGVIEMHGCMMVFGVVSFLGIFFVYFVMEETNGKCLDTNYSIKKVNSGVQIA